MSNKTQTQVQSHRAAMKWWTKPRNFISPTLNGQKKVAKIAWYVAGGSYGFDWLGRWARLVWDLTPS